MPSLTDIPEHLKPISRREDFKAWVKGLLVPWTTKKSLASLWARLNNTTWAAHEYTEMGASL